MGTTYGKKKQEATESYYLKQLRAGKKLDVAALRAAANKTVHGDTMSAEEVQRIKDARAALRALKQFKGKAVNPIDYTKKGYGVVKKSSTKAGGTTPGRGGVTTTGDQVASALAGTGASPAVTAETRPSGTSSNRTTTKPGKADKRGTRKTAGRGLKRDTASGLEQLPGKPGSLKFAQAAIARQDKVKARKSSEQKTQRAAATSAAAMNMRRRGPAEGPNTANRIAESILDWSSDRVNKQKREGAARQAAAEAEELRAAQAVRTAAQTKKRKKLIDAGYRPKKTKSRGGGITGR